MKEKINALNVKEWLDRQISRKEDLGETNDAKISSRIAEVLESRISADLCCDDDRFLGVKNQFDNYSWEIFKSQTKESALIALENFLYLPFCKEDGLERLKEAVKHIIGNSILGEHAVIENKIEIASHDVEELILERAKITRADCKDCINKKCSKRTKNNPSLKD